MNPEENKDNLEGFGKVVDALHNKSKLAALRTYQGDMAEFIKEKNESVISVAVKEKKREEERKEKEEKKIQTGEIKLAPQKASGKFLQNFLMALVSLALVGAGALVVVYLVKNLKKEPAPVVALEDSIIPYNDSTTLALSSADTLASGLSQVSAKSGITLVKVSGPDGVIIEKSKDLFELLKISLPFTLSRNLKDDYALGAILQEEKTLPFIVLKVSDFGGGFAGMLDWEDKIYNDLAFLKVASTTGMFTWKDIIVKNKDTRALVNEMGRSKIAWTFLDKNTLLIIGDVSATSQISSLYSSRSVAR